MTDSPIACDWSSAELAERRQELLPGLIEQAVERVTLPNGFRWRFEPESELLSRIGAVIDGERRCCRFLRFRTDVDPDHGAVWLEVTGPSGTVAFLTELGSLRGA